MDGSFDLYADPVPASPVVLSVPHAGRDYPLALRAALQVPLAALRPLEDRHVDAVALAARGRETLIVQRRARAWIDLNRGEDERDPRVDEGADPKGQPMGSAKVRSGLGLVPRRALGAGSVWRRRFADADIATRIARDHRPYHAALSTALACAQARFGTAILIDLHSMPPLASGVGIVLGDRFGRAAGARFVACADAVARGAGFATALNLPYAGGHTLTTHGRPAAGIHAIQVEIDRALYLDAALDMPGNGIEAIAAMLRAMIAALASEALAQRYDCAAE
ncbi:N-formylglutamate amidohydrolase [Sphingomonas oligophenolica]|uniref:N-formylglutamate amidohydrolase n=1 Tax=Sphingomonas oligophenolica TaxID=301154 RepID=A0A502CRD1_9SPHN|nr:N-formylglutamate amidohydrolase [Sphingomonas oligophenolica]TPG15292.1 N-formylglutamate amidohydrolase [Sphingomonas oligophenolica]